MTEIKSNQDQFKILANNPNNKPFVMLNLLKFKGKEGRESYLRYLTEARSHSQGVGTKVLYFGKPKELLQGTEDWDLLMLIEYPSRKAFLEMINNPDYQKAQEYRVKGVERAVLYAKDPSDPKDILEP